MSSSISSWGGTPIRGKVATPTASPSSSIGSRSPPTIPRKPYDNNNNNGFISPNTVSTQSPGLLRRNPSPGRELFVSHHAKPNTVSSSSPALSIGNAINTSSGSVKTNDLRTEYWSSRSSFVSIASQPLAHYEPHTAGIGLIVIDGLAGGRIGVLTVVHDSPAERSGQVCVGDVVVSVGGRPVTGWTLDEVRKAIQGPAGTACPLVLQRGEQRISVTLIRQSQEALELRSRALEERVSLLDQALRLEHRLRNETVLKRLEGAVSSWRNRQVFGAFSCWKQGVLRRSRNRNIVKGVVKRMQHLLLSQAFDTMRDGAQNARRMRAVHKAVGRWRLRHVAPAFYAWNLKTVGAAHRRAVASQAARRIRNLRVSRAFDTLRVAVVAGRRLRKVQSIIARWRMGAAAPALDAWKALTVRRKFVGRVAQNAHERCRRVQLARVLSQFTRATYLSRMEKVMAEIERSKAELAHVGNALNERELALRQAQMTQDAMAREHQETLRALDQRIAKYEAQIRAMERTSNEDREALAAAQAEISRLKAERDSLRVEIEKTMQVIVSLREEMRTMAAAHEQRMAALAAERDDTINAILRDHSKSMSSLESKMALDKEMALRQASEDHAATLKLLQHSKQQELEALNHQFIRRLETETIGFERRIEALNARHDEALASAVRLEQLKLDAEVEANRTERHRLETALKIQTDLEASFRAREAEHAAALQNAQRAAREQLLMELQAAEDRHKEEVARALKEQAAKFEQETEKRAAAYASELAALQHHLQIQARDELAARVDAWNMQNTENAYRHMEEIERLQLNHRNDLEATELRHHATIRKMRVEMEEVRERLQVSHPNSSNWSRISAVTALADPPLQCEETRVRRCAAV